MKTGLEQNPTGEPDDVHAEMWTDREICERALCFTCCRSADIGLIPDKCYFHLPETVYPTNMRYIA